MVTEREMSDDELMEAIAALRPPGAAQIPRWAVMEFLAEAREVGVPDPHAFVLAAAEDARASVARALGEV